MIEKWLKMIEHHGVLLILKSLKKLFLLKNSIPEPKNRIKNDNLVLKNHFNVG
jgi:hypothetical protein